MENLVKKIDIKEINKISTSDIKEIKTSNTNKKHLKIFGHRYVMDMELYQMYCFIGEFVLITGGFVVWYVLYLLLWAMYS